MSPEAIDAAPVQADYIVIGAGMAGASAAYWLAPHARVVVLERESQPGYHTTGRSAATFMESYGTAQVRALTRASRRFLQAPPAGFCTDALLQPRAALFVASAGEEAALAAHWELLQASGPGARRLSAAQAHALVPVLREAQLHGAVLDTGAADMDVHALHQGFLRGLRRCGGQLVCNAEVSALQRTPSGWQVQAGGQRYTAPVVLNAAGAWVDQIAALAGAAPIGIEPRRRSAFVFAPPEGMATRDWPMTIGVNEDWYFKPDAGLLLASPANADPVAPQDVQPEEMDIALGIDRIERVTSLQIRRPIRTWAGLRSFVADGDLVGGFDAQLPGFFWVAAQGGYGIQTAPAMGECCAALARGLPLPAHAASFGVTADMLSPARLHPSAAHAA